MRKVVIDPAAQRPATERQRSYWTTAMGAMSMLSAGDFTPELRDSDIEPESWSGSELTNDGIARSTFSRTATTRRWVCRQVLDKLYSEHECWIDVYKKRVFQLWREYLRSCNSLRTVGSFRHWCGTLNPEQSALVLVATYLHCEDAVTCHLSLSPEQFNFEQLALRDSEASRYAMLMREAIDGVSIPEELLSLRDTVSTSHRDRVLGGHKGRESHKAIRAELFRLWDERQHGDDPETYYHRVKTMPEFHRVTLSKVTAIGWIRDNNRGKK